MTYYSTRNTRRRERRERLAAVVKGLAAGAFVYAVLVAVLAIF